MSDETTPGPDLREQIAGALGAAAVNLNYAPEGLADAVMVAVRPELDRRDAEIRRLGEQNTLLIAMLERIPEVHMRFHVVGEELAEVCADWCCACKFEQAEAERDQLKSTMARFRTFLDGAFRFWCSPHGIAGQYADALIEELDRLAALEQGKADLPAVREFVAEHDPREEPK